MALPTIGSPNWGGPLNDMITVMRSASLGLAARWTNTAFDPPVAPDLPTISKSVTSSAYTFTISSPTQVRPLRTTPGNQATNVDMAGDTHFRYDGAPTLTPNGVFNTFVNTGLIPGGSAQAAYWNLTVTFDTAAPDIEFLNRSVLANSPFGRLKVNGRIVQEADITHTNTAGQWLFTKLTFPDSRMRRIEVTFERTLAFFGVGVTTGYGVYRPQEPVTRRIAFIGDSFTGGVGAAPTGYTSTESWALRLAQLMGADGIVQAGIGGSRWVPTAGASGDAALGHFQGRLSTVLAMSPHVVVFFGSRNDDNAAPAPIQASVEAALLACAAVPEVYVSGTASPGGGQWAINTAVAAGAAAKRRPFVDLSRIVYGTGKAGTLTNDGNADQYLQSDGVHPTHAFQKFIAEKFYLGIAGNFTSV